MVVVVLFGFCIYIYICVYISPIKMVVSLFLLYLIKKKKKKKKKLEVRKQTKTQTGDGNLCGSHFGSSPRLSPPPAAHRLPPAGSAEWRCSAAGRGGARPTRRPASRGGRPRRRGAPALRTKRRRLFFGAKGTVFFCAKRRRNGEQNKKLQGLLGFAVVRLEDVFGPLPGKAPEWGCSGLWRAPDGEGAGRFLEFQVLIKVPCGRRLEGCPWSGRLRGSRELRRVHWRGSGRGPWLKGLIPG